MGGVAAAVIALGAAVIVPAVRDEPVSASATGAVPARQSNADGELPWTARGPLAGDDGLLRDALRTWQAGVPDRQRPSTAAVLYAGAPDGTRTVLLQGVDGTGQSWVAEVADGRLRTTEPLGRTVPLLALVTTGGTRLLTPPANGPALTLLARDAGTLRPLTVDADGLSEPVTLPPAGLPVALTAGTVATGSGRILPGRLSAVTGRVELAQDTVDLGPADVTATWYDDGELLAGRLGGAVTVAGLGPVRTIRVKNRRVDARAYEAVHDGARYLATVIRVDGKAACVATSPTGPADSGPARPPVLVSRCLTAGADGVVQAVGGAGVRSVRIRLAGPAAGRPARDVVISGASGRGLVALARIAALPTGPLQGIARDSTGKQLTRFIIPAYKR